MEGGQDDVALLDRLRVRGEELHDPFAARSLRDLRAQGGAKGLPLHGDRRQLDLLRVALELEGRLSPRAKEVDAGDAQQPLLGFPVGSLGIPRPWSRGRSTRGAAPDTRGGGRDQRDDEEGGENVRGERGDRLGTQGARARAEGRHGGDHYRRVLPGSNPFPACSPAFREHAATTLRFSSASRRSPECQGPAFRPDGCGG